jgi:hypothetical protein
MIVYVGGDGHAAAAAASPYLKANNDSELFYLGTVPHPANLAVSWAQWCRRACILGSTFAELPCHAQLGVK